ncbi:MAG: hypothetical protein EBS86_08925 [Crocinitomicaceae bacterium]|nr:hypothetical protein [Crocinitomicaceae bacterium]
MKNKILFLALLSFLFSCNNDSKKSKEMGAEAVSAEAKQIDTTTVNQDPPDDYAEGNFDTEEVFPFDVKILSYLVLPNFSGHDTDELSKLKKQKEWMGLYQVSDEQFEIKRAKVKFDREYDPIMDEEKGPFTGITTEVSPSENCVIAFNPIFGTQPKSLNAFLPANFEIQPNRKKSFNYNGTKYSLISTGTPVKEEYRDGIKDFTLTLSYTYKNGEQKSQLLMQVPTYSEYSLPQIIVTFCGLIDGDDFPDFIIRDNNQNYLFLSNDSNGNEALRCVGTEVIFGGC